MRRQRNTSCILTAKLGARLRPLRHRFSRRVAVRLIECLDGPWRGYKLALSDPLSYTLPVVIRGVVGSYRNGVWCKQ